MPGKDGSGPMGSGPRTGRGADVYAGNQAPDNVNQTQGRSFGRGLGRRHGFGGGMGRGRRMRRGVFSAETAPQEERSFLENEMEALQSRLDCVKQQLENFEADEIPDK